MKLWEGAEEGAQLPEPQVMAPQLPWAVAAGPRGEGWRLEDWAGSAPGNQLLDA